MTIEVVLTQITRTVFILLGIVTLVDFLRYRDKVRRDVALLVGSIALAFVVGIIADLLGIQDRGMRRIASLLLLVQPYMLLRIVRYFRSVNRYINWFAHIGLAVSALILLPFIQNDVIPVGPTLVFFAYFTLVDGYAVYAFIQGAVSSSGVVGNRLRLAAVGSALLVIVLLIAALRTLLPVVTPTALPVTQLLVILSALAYFLSFATPRWLRQFWQLVELRDFLTQVQAPGNSRNEIISTLVQAVSRAMTTENIAVLRADEAQKALEVEELCAVPLMQKIPLQGTALRSMTQREPLVVLRTSLDSDDDLLFMEELNVEIMIVVPIATTERIFGVLAVCLEHGSLFIEDDVQLLTVLVRQTATMLENDAAVMALQRHNEQLERQVKQRTAALARSNQELRQFASVASHDLKEPLRTISSYLQLIEQRYADKLDDDGHEFINFAVDGAARMKDLIDDLLIYSRVERQESNIRMVDMQKVLDEARRLLEISIEEAEATITQDPMPEIRADESLMVQLLQNLLSNALKYRGERKPEIHLSAKQSNGDWQFSVRDNGIGIDSAYLDNIFIIFRRLHSQGEYSGTGIGLAVCKKAVEIHGGRIWAESELGQGTTFFFTIPR